MTGREQLPPSLRAEFAGELTVFDRKPLSVGNFRLKARSVIAIGRPGETETKEAIGFALACEDGSPYWVGDLLAYAKERGFWDQAMEVVEDLHMTPDAAYKKHYVSTHVGARSRKIAPTYHHAVAVASLPEAEQLDVLNRAAANQWTVAETRKHARQVKRRDVIEAQGTLVGVYRCISAAPKWSTSRIQDLMKLPVAAHTWENAVLFLRTSATALVKDPGCIDVMRAWGFEPTGAQIIWDRVDRTMTGHTYCRHEVILIGTRGQCEPDHPENIGDSVFVHRQSWDDPTTPRDLLRVYEKLYDGPRLELFGNERRGDEWDTFGDDFHEWHKDAAEQAAGATQ